MQSLSTQKKMVRLLYLQIIAVVMLMLPRYMQLAAVTDTDVYLRFKYIAVAILTCYVTTFLLVYFLGVARSERKVDLHGWGWVFGLAISVTVFSFFVGVVNGNRTYYLTGDAFRQGVPWLLLYLFIWQMNGLVSSGRMKSIETFLEIMAYVGIVEAIATFVIRSMVPGLRVSTNLYLWSIAWALYQQRRSLIIALPVLLVGVSAGLASGKRASVVVVFLFFVVYLIYMFRLFLGRNDRNSYILGNRINVQVVLLLAFIILILVFFPVVSDIYYQVTDSSWVTNIISTVDNVIKILSGKVDDSSFRGRWIEWETIADYMANHPEAILWGCGFGAEIPADRYGVVKTDAGTMHNTHSAWAGYFLRSGVFGLILLACFLLKLFYMVFRYRSQFLNWQYFCFAFLVIIAASSISSNVMQESYGEPFIAALLNGLIVYGRQGQNDLICPLP